MPRNWNNPITHHIVDPVKTELAANVFVGTPEPMPQYLAVGVVEWAASAVVATQDSADGLIGSPVGTIGIGIAVKDSSGNYAFPTLNADGGLNVHVTNGGGGGGDQQYDDGSTPTPPIVGTAALGVDNTGVVHVLSVDPSGALNITGTISATNPSVGTTGATAPTSATEVGFIDGSGNLVAPSSTAPLPVTVISGGGSPNVNLIEVGGAAIALGQTVMASSLPVTIASDQSALTVTGTVAVTQSGSWTVTANQGTSPWVENLTEVGGAAFALGQQLAAASLPVVLTAAQIITLTPPTAAAIGTAVSGDLLIGTQLASASVPVALPTATITTLTPPTAAAIAAAIVANPPTTFNGIVTNAGTFAVQAAQSGTWNVGVTGTVVVSGTVAATQSGSWTVTANAGTGTFNTQDVADGAVTSPGGSAPAFALQLGFWDGTTYVPVDAANPLPVTGGGGGGGNDSVGITGITAPTSATEIGYIDDSGNLVAPSEATPLPVSTQNWADAGNSPLVISVGTSSTTILNSNTARKGCNLVNMSFETISLAFGAAAVLYQGVTLGPGGSFWMDAFDFTTNAINAISTNAALGGSLGVQEYQ